ncbi:flavin-containing monooxygenase [Oleomonas cavernae]|uniref:flavin-containing monooxygenase n=1 Tax=Oleomonas cavernae TaxID=2320859 RepID=UPI001F28E3AE|nr:NAD(P)/FAD-dependent oxidoreductase [Oleomonas cavernae]
MTKETIDVIVIGAGLSGIGAAAHLQKRCPSLSYTVVEMRDALGGTWDLFRYPGIRSDSDMYTLGYNFKPWTHPDSIADGSTIRDYIRETAREYGIDRHIRYNHRVESLDWDSRKARWTLRARKTGTGEVVAIESRFVICCAGYYRYDQGFTPEFPGRESFRGQVIHPQAWPENLEYSGKRVVVIGSGATAVTLVPSLAEKAGHVTMLQRSPSYVASMPKAGTIANRLRKYLPEKAVYALTRVAHIGLAMAFYSYTRARPEAARRFLLKQVQKQVGTDFDMKHFTPDITRGTNGFALCRTGICSPSCGMVGPRL